MTAPESIEAVAVAVLSEKLTNPYLPVPPSDGKHVFNGLYRCARCAVYNRPQPENPAFYEPCEGRWAQSGKMRRAAEERWAEELARGAQALADAGLLADGDGETQWGIRGPLAVVWELPEEDARLIGRHDGYHLISRRVTEWSTPC